MKKFDWKKYYRMQIDIGYIHATEEDARCFKDERKFDDKKVFLVLKREGKETVSFIVWSMYDDFDYSMDCLLRSKVK